MTPADLVHRLSEQDIKLSLRLVVDAPKGANLEEIQATLKAHKSALVHHLAREALWAELAQQRWGPALEDGEPGQIVDNPDPAQANYQPSANPDDPEWLARKEADEPTAIAPNR